MRGDGAAAGSPGELESLRDRIHAARSEGNLGELFEALAAAHGRTEASRLWLAAFAESDASET